MGEAFASSAWGEAEAGLHSPLSTLKAVTTGTSIEDSPTNGQGKGKGMPPVKSEVQAGEWDLDHLLSIHPISSILTLTC